MELVLHANRRGHLLKKYLFIYAQKLTDAKLFNYSVENTTQHKTICYKSL